MALNNFEGIINQLLVRNNRTTTDGFITDQMLFDWAVDANTWATAFHKWPFTEEFTSVGTYGALESNEYPQFAKADSIRTIFVGSFTGNLSFANFKEFKKVNFREYVKYRGENPQGTEKIFSDNNRVIYVNPNARDVSGDIYAFYQNEDVLNADDDLLGDTGTVFSNYDQEGNEAIVEKMTSYLKRREHLPDEAQVHDDRAKVILEEVWKRIQDEQFAYQAGPRSPGMYERFDVVNGGFRDDLFRRDQFI